MKMLRVTMPDGSKWDVPAQIIAADRATYYADHDNPEGSSVEELAKTYREEFDYTMQHPSVIKDWSSNNMNWSDVQDKAVRVADPTTGDYQEGWMNGEKEIVEVPK